MDYKLKKQSKILKININKLKDYKAQIIKLYYRLIHLLVLKIRYIYKTVEIGGIMSHKWLTHIENNITTLKYILYLIGQTDIIHISQSIYNLLQIISFYNKKKDSN